MIFARTHVVPLLAAFMMASCSQDGGNGAATTAPSPIAAATSTAPLVVQVDVICAGRESDIRVFVDAVQIGITNPGEAGVSQRVTVGQHQLSAISKRGTQWGPFPTTVTDGGHLERLGCMPSGGI